jgi:hypothetical protein
MVGSHLDMGEHNPNRPKSPLPHSAAHFLFSQSKEEEELGMEEVLLIHLLRELTVMALPIPLKSFETIGPHLLLLPILPPRLHNITACSITLYLNDRNITIGYEISRAKQFRESITLAPIAINKIVAP